VADGPPWLLLVAKIVARRHRTDKWSAQFGHGRPALICAGIVVGEFPMSEPAPATDDSWKLRTIDCPRCAEPLAFRRNGGQRIDACGLESHRLDCRSCDAVLTGVVDPYDEALLVSAARPVAWVPNAELARRLGGAGREDPLASLSTPEAGTY
jgi:hypothetical protein